MKFALPLVGLLAAIWPSSQSCRGADWPTYMADNQRSGWTDEEMTLPLEARWIYSPPSTPRRAWSGPEGRTIEGKELRDRVKFDDALNVAAVGGRVYFGSSIDHQVYCRDADTGKKLWSFFTGAPVRLAPTVVAGRVYVGSDDGHAYCLDARDGRLVWKVRPGPADEWILGRGEMISRWPVRTGVLLDDGVAYFGAGIFPHENVYLCAADAATGRILWRNDNISHQDAGRNDLSPQGYLLAADDLVFVPSGRSRPKAVNRKTGKLSGAGGTSLNLKQTVVAGTDALVAGGRLHTYSLGTRLAAADGSLFVANGQEIVRLQPKEYSAANSERAKIASEIRALRAKLPKAGDQAPKIRAQIKELEARAKDLQDKGVVWRASCAAEAALIVAGSHVFAGQAGKVAAFDAATGEPAWSAEVEGTARGLAVADGKLFVSTTSGKIFCFAETATDAQPTADSLADNPYPKDDWTGIYAAAADDILKRSGVTRGYCLVVGSERGRLAYELARRSELKIYAVEPDEKKVEQARRALASAGLYGNRISILQADLEAIPYSNFFANLIVSDRLLLSGEIPRLDKVERHLKPAGGVICLGRPANAPGGIDSDALENWLERTALREQAVATKSASWITVTRGALPGAGNWSHQYAEPGNSASSGDKLVKGGLGVLWYGDPGPGEMVNRHQGAVGPLVVDGRMFVQGENNLMAYDAYNGMLLWKVENPEAIRTGVFQNRHPGNLAAGGDRVFHMVRHKVFDHDAASGEVKAVHELPANVDEKTHEWGYVAFHDGLLFGTATMRKEVVEQNRRRRGDPGSAATDTIFAIDVKTGEHLWAYQGKSIDFQTIAVGPERIFFIDSSVTSEQRAAILRQDKSELQKLTGEARKRAEERLKKLDLRLAVALNSESGEKIWERPVDVTDCSEIGIGGGKLTMMYHDDVLILCGANANGHYWRQFVAGEFSRRRLVALYAQDGKKLWAKDANYRHRPIIVGQKVIAEPWAFDLRQGDQQMRKHPLTGKEVPWSIMRPGHHCGMLTASDNLLLFRSGYTGFYDLEADAGTRHFAGHRLGCWINAIPANGLVVIPEASAGCVCMFSIASTIVFEPRSARRPWSLYSGVGPTTPVQHMALNFGAPGDRRDRDGKLWLAYPRPTPNPRLETSLDLKLGLETKFSPGGGFFSSDGDDAERHSSDLAWVSSSGGRGLTRCSIPLLNKEDKPAAYRVRLHFGAEEADKAGHRAFDVRVQGKTVLMNVDVADQEIGEARTMVRQLDSVSVTDVLLIELLSKAEPPSPGQMPILNGIEVERIADDE